MKFKPLFNAFSLTLFVLFFLLSSFQTAHSQTNSYIPTTSFHYGATGSDVQRLQDILVSQGYLTLTAEDYANGGYGTFGPKTRAALAAYQSANDITGGDNGYWYGPRTMESLQNQNPSLSNIPAIPNQPGADTLPPPAPTIPSQPTPTQTPPPSPSATPSQTGISGSATGPTSSATPGTTLGIPVRYQCNPTAGQVTGSFNCPAPNYYGLIEQSTNGPCPISGLGSKYQWVCGTLSFFGGSTDSYQPSDDKLAGISNDYGTSYAGLQSYSQYYSSMRWNYSQVDKAKLSQLFLQLYNPRGGANACVNTIIVDWGPRPGGTSGERSFDISHYTGTALGAGTDSFIYGRLIPRAGNKVGLTDTCFR